MPSEQFSLNKTDFKNVLHTGLVFLAPLGVIYFGSVVSALQSPGHIFGFKDLAIGSFQMGLMVLYIANRLYDLFLKFVGK